MLSYRKLWIATLTLGAVCFAAPARAAEIDKLTPADAQAVMVFNVRQALDSPLAKKKGVVDMVKAKIDGNPQAKLVLAAFGLDVTKDVESVAMAAGNLTDFQPNKTPEKMLVIVRGNFDPERIDAAARKADTIKVTKEGNTTVYEFKDKDDTGYATLIGKSIIAASPSKDYLLQAVKNIGGGSKELVKAAAKVDDKQSMWMAMVISEDMRTQMAKSGPPFKDIAPKLESVNLGVSVSDSIVLDVNINTTDGDAPKAIKTQIDAILPFIRPGLEGDEKTGELAKEIFNNLKISANPTALNVNLKVSETTLDKIIKLAAKQLQK